MNDALYFWGNDLNLLGNYAKSWAGEFPVNNTQEDGFERLAPVISYPKNDFGLYDMTGSV